jgi:hypothetical protein
MTARYTIVASKERLPAFPDIAARDGHPCGRISLDDLPELDKIGPHEFLILSQARSESYFVPSRICQADLNYDAFYVMLITRDADGIVERRGIGKVLQSSLDSSFEPGPRWEDIILG